MYAWIHTLYLKDVLLIIVCTTNTCVIYSQKCKHFSVGFFLALLIYFLQIYFSALIQTMHALSTKITSLQYVYNIVKGKLERWS